MTTNLNASLLTEQIKSALKLRTKTLCFNFLYLVNLSTFCSDSSHCEGQIQSCEKVTSVTDKWLVAVVNTDARLLATVRLSSLVSCSTRWYLKKKPQVLHKYVNKRGRAIKLKQFFHGHSLLLRCLQLLHGLIVTVINLLLKKLTMVLH